MTDAVAEIEDWLKASGWKESRLGSMSCANQRVVDSLRSGNGTVKNLDKVLKFIRANPADDVGK